MSEPMPALIHTPGRARFQATATNTEKMTRQLDNVPTKLDNLVFQ